MSLLSGVDKLIADIAGPLVFERALLLRGGTYSINPATGQTVFVPSTENIRVVEGDYSAFHRQSLDIPDINRKLDIIGHGVSIPRPGDRASVRGVIWEIVRIERDPAGALYSCEVKPIGADIAGDPGATVNALTPLPGLIADIAGPLLFGTATLFVKSVSGVNANGQATRTEAPRSIKALEVEYTATHRAQAGIPETDRSILILGAGLSEVPTPGDKVDINGLRFEIVRTGRDPARAVYECQSRPIGEAVSIRLATHNGVLMAFTGTATGELGDISNASHAGILPAFISISNAVALISATSENSLPAFAGTATAEAGSQAENTGTLPPYTGNATASVSVAADHAGSLPAFAGQGASGVQVSATQAGTLPPFAGSATGEVVPLGIIGEHTGTLPAYAGEALSLTAIASDHTGTLPAFTGTSQISTAVAASSLQSLPAYEGSAEGLVAVSGQSEGILPAYAGTAVAVAGSTGAQTGALAAFAGTAAGQALVSGTASGTLPAYTGTATGTVAAAGPSFDAFTIHAWNPAGGSNASGLIANAIGSPPMYARRGNASVNNWNGTHTDYQHAVLDEPDAQSILTGANRTISFWVRRDSTSGTFHAIANYAQDYPDNGGTEGGWTFFFSTGSTLFSSIRNEFGFGSGASNAAFTADTWHFIVLTIGPNQWRYYLDGSLVGDYTGFAAANLDQNRVLKFGPSEPGLYDSYTDTFPTSGSQFDGQFGDIRVHNKILNGTEISALYSAGRQSY